MDNPPPISLARRLADLRSEHRDLDTLVDRLVTDPGADQLMLVRFKKRKLRLKDEIAWIEGKLIPDLDA